MSVITYNLLDFASDLLRNDAWTLRSTTTSFPIDVYENENEVIVEAELPGIEVKDIEVSVLNGVLTIKGKKICEKRNGKDCFRIERCFGSFNRSFVLPTSVDAERVEAKSINGVLIITIQKKEKSLPKKIKVLTK